MSYYTILAPETGLLPCHNPQGKRTKLLFVAQQIRFIVAFPSERKEKKTIMVR